jgi:hypothetical protein
LVLDLKKEEERESMISLGSGLNRETETKLREEQEGFWRGHSIFQLPVRILSMKGKAEAVVLTYFYEYANTRAFYANTSVVVEIEVKEQTLMNRTRLSRPSVYRTIDALEEQDFIRVTRRRDPLTGEKSINVYLLLHSMTKEPLFSTPREWGICNQNGDRPYITAPKETRERLTEMSAAARQTYLAALSLASKRVRTSFSLPRDEWKTETTLGRNAFDRGVNECVARGLLTYSRYVLTLNDPKTAKPSGRVKKEFIHHENTNWKTLDFKDVTPEQWKKVVEKLLRTEFILGDSGWTHGTRTTVCPLCKETRSFRLNFKEQEYRCHACENFGKLGQLVQRVLKVTSMEKVKLFILEVLEEERSAAEKQALAEVTI